MKGNNFKKYVIPVLMGLGTTIYGLAQQEIANRETEDRVRKATYDEFNRLARSKPDGGPRHTGPKNKE